MASRLAAFTIALLGCQPQAEACCTCDAGTIVDDVCVYPSIADYDLVDGLPAADTGTRQLFDPESYTGTDWAKIQQAIWAADDVDGAVVLSHVYEIERDLVVNGPMMLTGGGIRRACQPDVVLSAPASAADTCVDVTVASGFLTTGETVLATSGPAFADSIATLGVSTVATDEVCFYAPVGVDLPAGTRLARTHSLLKVSPVNLDGVVIDSVMLDGNNRCASYTHDWRYNSVAQLRGRNVVRDSVLYDTPGEAFTTCGAKLERNHAFELQGALIHKSCSVWPSPADLLIGNHVDGVNLAGDTVMQHSEGAITASANAGNVFATGNVFLHGGETVFGLRGPDDEDTMSTGDCYAHFRAVVTLQTGANPERFHFSAELVDVPLVFE